jgi:two-component system, NtrC family, response regulator AlgB
MAALRALVVDDEKNIRTTLAMCLEGLGCEVAVAATPEAARSQVTHQPFDLAFVDLRLADASGLDLVPELIAVQPQLHIVIITAYATIDTAVAAVKRGAREYLPKPFTPAQIRKLVNDLYERRKLERKVEELEAQLKESVPEADLQTGSPRMRAALETAVRAAGSDVSVLLRGESGTGKGVLARLVHTRSGRAAAPFVTVNCPTLSGELLASELFGHVKGSFTGAVRDQPGRVEAAEGGTLFLDEIAEIPPTLQAKLLRFVQDREFERLGENRTRRADVRVVTATNRDLTAAVAQGSFREDLLYRLNVVEIVVPPLRERSEDVLPLARHLLTFFAVTAGRPAPELSPEAERVLLAYAWPGNVRELRNVIEHAVMLWPAATIEPHAFPERIAGRTNGGPALGSDASLDAIEREHILRVLARKPTLEAAAESLGIDASTLWRKRKKYGV